jgi:uncharacterized protein YdaU (DUF1376 family)
VHHYPFHVGDYIRATAHLDMIEDCVYRRLIDLYMETELPIPNETQQVIRRLRLGSSGLILESILAEFFTLEADNCWHNSRCDAEIREYKRLAETSRINGRLGGRPKKTQQVILDNPAGTQQEPTGLQPRTNNQEPITTSDEVVRSNRFNARNRLAELGVKEPILSDWLAVRKAKRAPLTETAILDIQSEASKAGLTFADAVAHSCKNSWQGFKASWLDASRKTPQPENFESRDYGTGGLL